MSSKPYSPLKALGRARRAMDSATAKQRPAQDTPISLTTTAGPIPCAVLLRSLTDGGPVPDDFSGFTTSRQIKEHVRPDGAVFIGAFELQGDRSSVVLMYGASGMPIEKAEKLATLERPALIDRHERAKLGVFGMPQPQAAS